MSNSTINMNGANLLYGAGLVALIATLVAVKRVPQVALSTYVSFPFQIELAVTLFILGAVSGVFSMLRQAKRVKAPWAMPQSAVAIPYLVFFFSSFSAILLAN